MDKDFQNELIDQMQMQLRQVCKQQEKAIKLQIDNIYTQLESLSWLQRTLSIKGGLPPLRGWPVSPDFLLLLHGWIRKHKPQVIIETGSGASTLVIADALRQNGTGVLISLEHLKKYGEQTWQTLVDEGLTEWVDLRLNELVLWSGEHLNPESADKLSRWYSFDISNIYNVDLLVVDGPPGGTCQYARYPAVPALFDRLAANAEVWMDDANRQDEKDICERWAELYGFNLEYSPLEKGLIRLTRLNTSQQKTVVITQTDFIKECNSIRFEDELGLDFTLPEERHSH
ncbi:class I SAM-dependent methyltransferase [Vreelandella aquamarina]